MGQLHSTNCALRQIHVTYEDHKRLVPLENDTYEALLDGFLEFFKDVLPVSLAQAREIVWFQRYDAAHNDYVDIIPGSSIVGVKKVKATLDIESTRIGQSYPLINNKKYALWALGSHADNGYLRRKDATIVTADGDGDTVECEWLAHDVRTSAAVYWKFSNPDNTKVLVVENGQVTLKNTKSVPGTTDQFLPTRNGRYQSFLPRADAEDFENSDKKFLGADGNGTVKMMANKNPQPTRNQYNPSPQTLFVPFLRS